MAARFRCRRWGLFIFVLFSTAIIVLASGCGEAGSGSKKPGTDLAKAPLSREKGVAPPRWVKAKREVTLSDEKIAKGKALFAACAACHGTAGEGKVGTGPRLASKSFLEAAGDDFLKKTISEGRAGTTMIAWKNSYSPEQIEALVAYIRSLLPTEPAELNEAPLRGDSARGGKIFSKVCAKCHGRNGAGYQESSSGTGIGRKAFLETASNGYLRYILKHGKSLTPMRPFDKNEPTAEANLTDQEIDDIIAYLRANAW